jgi:hypothetical protein
MSETITKHVSVKLNDEEFQMRAQRLAQVDRELGGVKAQKAKVTADFAAKTKTLEAERESLINTVASRTEERPVTCDEVPDQSAGVVYFVRQDTKERVGHRPMSSHEKQLSLPSVDQTRTPQVIDTDGEIHDCSQEQRDALRNAIQSGEKGVTFTLPSGIAKYCVAIVGETVPGAVAKPKGRKKGTRKGGSTVAPGEVAGEPAGDAEDHDTIHDGDTEAPPPAGNGDAGDEDEVPPEPVH